MKAYPLASSENVEISHTETVYKAVVPMWTKRDGHIFRKGSMMSNQKEYNRRLIEEFRSNGGKVSGKFADVPLLLLTVLGARSNQPRTTPLAYTTDRDRFILIASNNGSSSHPDWYYNLLAHPIVTVEVGPERFQARAVIAEEPERSRLYTQMADQMPAFAEYQRNTERKIPVIVLERIDS